MISVRRLAYLENILSKHDNEVVSKVYYAMKFNPLKDDLYNLDKADFNMIGMDVDEVNQHRFSDKTLTTYKKKTFEKREKKKTPIGLASFASGLA